MNEWKEAMLEGLAAHALDAPADMPPVLILNLIVGTAVAMALDQKVSSLARTCTWTQEDDIDMPGVYRTGCGELWSFSEGGVEENGMRYCHHCGGKVTAINCK